MAIVADGMGGHEQGAKAAQILVRTFQSHPDDPNEAAAVASQSMDTQDVGDGGACFAAVRITEKNGQKYLDISQAGDVKVLIIRKGQLVFESVDQSLVQELVDKGGLTQDEAQYYPLRNVVENYIGKDKHNPKIYNPIPLEKGDLVFIMSDGISDNLTPQEIIKLIGGAKRKQIIQVISKVTGIRMKNYKKIKDETAVAGGREKLGEFSDGFKSDPKPDNRGIAVIEIK
jgi:protein phosphatase